MTTFRYGRDFAAWLGLVPRQFSSGGKERLGRVSKAGQADIRRLLIIGAMLRQKRSRRLSCHFVGQISTQQRHRSPSTNCRFHKHTSTQTNIRDISIYPAAAAHRPICRESGYAFLYQPVSKMAQLMTRQRKNQVVVADTIRYHSLALNRKEPAQPL